MFTKALTGLVGIQYYMREQNLFPEGILILLGSRV